MKVGDLVNFHARSQIFEHANCDYELRNPGIIISVKSLWRGHAYEVLWANSDITTEADAYLEKHEKD